MNNRHLPGMVFTVVLIASLLSFNTALAQFFGHPADEGKIVKGVLIRTYEPSFTVKIPKGMKLGKSYSNTTIWSGTQKVSPYSMNVDVYEDVDDLDALGNGIINGFRGYAESIKSKKFEVLRSEMIESYKGHEAKEIQFNWIWTDGTELTTVIHLIIKGDHTIGISATTVGDTTPAIKIYKTINLNPK